MDRHSLYITLPMHMFVLKFESCMPVFLSWVVAILVKAVSFGML